MINKSSLIFYKGEMMIKYHNNLNKIALKGFNQRELGIFFAICSIMKEKGIQELEITFSELERIVGISFKDKSISSETLSPEEYISSSIALFL